MIQYFIDDNESYYNEVILHLRSHNQAFTGLKKEDSIHIYATKDNVLVGGLKANFSWDWVNLNVGFYNDINTLQDLLSKACEIYKERAFGFKVFTRNTQIKKDLIRLGLTYKDTLSISPRRGETHLLELTDLNIENTNKVHTTSSKDSIREYDIIMKEEQKRQRAILNYKGVLEEILYIGTDGENFVGGIRLELFEDSMHVNLLVVNKEYKGNKVGTHLMEYAEKVARERNFVSIDVSTTEFQAKPFYEKCGYKIIYTRKNNPIGFKNYILIKLLEKQE